MSVQTSQMQYLEQRKTPAVAILLSFIISGAGQIYNGEVGKGIGMIVAYIICWATSVLVFPLFIAVALWIWGMIDANNKAKEFNEALKQQFDQADEVKKEEEKQQAQIKATTISAQEFVGQVEKYLKLFQSSLLTETEFANKKKETIDQLTVKKIVEAPEDFLTAVIPLIQKQALSDEEISRVKAAVL